MSDQLVCADFGGVNQAGDPCQVPAGHGRDTNEGRCSDHYGDPNAERKETFLRLMEEELMGVQQAAREIERTRSTIYNWTQADPEFNERYQAAREKRREHRVQEVETSLFRRIINGEAAAAETIFWLKANSERYKQADKYGVEFSRDAPDEDEAEEIRAHLVKELTNGNADEELPSGTASADQS